MDKKIKVKSSSKLLEGPRGEAARNVLDQIVSQNEAEPSPTMEALMGGMKIEENSNGARRLPEGFDPDDDVFEPTFVEENPTAPIMDVEEEEETVSPPAGNPLQQAMTFQSIMNAAQAEVRTQAQEAMGSIARNLREVEGRSLRCLERELALQRREARMEERENELRTRERRAREMREAIANLEEMPPLATLVITRGDRGQLSNSQQ